MSQATQVKHRYRVLATDNPRYAEGEVLLFNKDKGGKTTLRYELHGVLTYAKLKYIGTVDVSTYEPLAVVEGGGQ